MSSRPIYYYSHMEAFNANCDFRGRSGRAGRLGALRLGYSNAARVAVRRSKIAARNSANCNLGPEYMHPIGTSRQQGLSFGSGAECSRPKLLWCQFCQAVGSLQYGSHTTRNHVRLVSSGSCNRGTRFSAMKTKAIGFRLNMEITIRRQGPDEIVDC